MAIWKSLLLLSGLASATLIERAESEPAYPDYDKLAHCKGYKASSVKERHGVLTANLKLNGKGCSVYGDDLKDLTLEVTYETGTNTTDSRDLTNLQL